MVFYFVSQSLHMEQHFGAPVSDPARWRLSLTSCRVGDRRSIERQS